ncbi:MAG TPA: exodeoxyribonuclease VII small subunit [Acidimicrobiales bacterium]|nr:exodeoxyribonuclease VII small subunit [Acidimicrobiales bacterium]
MDDRAAWDEMTFEELVAALEQLTARMASGDIGIEEVADLYEQAELLHALAAERLAKVQARIEALAAKEMDAP